MLVIELILANLVQAQIVGVQEVICWKYLCIVPAMHECIRKVRDMLILLPF